MSDLFWPGDERAGSLMTPTAFLQAMVRVETAWLAALVASDIAPAGAGVDLGDHIPSDAVDRVAQGAQAGGNPVIPLVALLRNAIRASHPDAATWMHKGLTSQDVVDTALMLCLRDVHDRLDAELRAQVEALVRLAEDHRGAVMAGRTLTQHAVPITFGLKAAGWLTGVLDAGESLRSARDDLAVQVGGAAGTLAAPVELARGAGLDASAALDLVGALADGLGLPQRAPWHTSRRPVTRQGDALVSCTDAWGRIATDVSFLVRPEVGELSEPTAQGRGGSSTMPHKQNPVLAVLIRRAAIAAPPLGSTLHTAAAMSGDERPDGAWHVEWATLRTLSRVAAVAAGQTTELLAGLGVHADRMRQTVDGAAAALSAERASLSPGTTAPPEDYLGATDAIVTRTVGRAHAYLEESR